MKTILIGTTNESKYKTYYELLSFLKDYSIELKNLSDVKYSHSVIIETLNDLKLNAIAKAVTYARHTGLFTIADDIGIFIPALNNEPGVAARRWGGKLPKSISDKDWEKYFLNRIKEAGITEPICIQRQLIACSDPKGKYQILEQCLIGRIKIPGCGHYVKGSPLSSYFFIEQCNRFKSELTDEEKENLFGDLKLKLTEIILNHFVIENHNIKS